MKRNNSDDSEDDDAVSTPKAKRAKLQPSSQRRSATATAKSGPAPSLTTLGPFRPGQIFELRVKNFVTYDEAVLRPGPLINLVIGPNGTGKSALVCALCLGLGGEPKNLCRQESIGDFVKFGQSEAFISVRIASAAGSLTTITRSFKREDKSTKHFTIDGKQVDYNTTRKFIHDLKIQVNNLCQFLPQERVREFAAMKPPEVLKECQRAVLGDDHVTMQEDLIRMLASGGQDQSEHDKWVVRAKELDADKTHAESELTRLQDKLRAEHECQMLRKTYALQAVIQAKEAKAAATTDAVDKKRQMEETQKLLSDAETPLKPLKHKIETINKKLLESKAQKPILERHISDSVQKIQKLQNDWEMHGPRVKLANQEELKRREELELLAAQVTEAKRQLAEAHNVDHSQRLNEIREETNKLTADRNRIAADRGQIQMRIAELKNARQQCNDKRQKLIDPVVQCLRLLQEKVRSNELRQGIARVHQVVSEEMKKQSRGEPCMFSGKVYGPIATEIQVQMPHHGAIVETAVQNALLRSFLVEDVHDREKILGLAPVDVTITPADNSSFEHPIDEASLKQYGVEGYLDAVVQMPEPVRRTLCTWNGFHKIVIGRNIDYERLFNNTNIRTAFDEKQQYTCQDSKYTGNKSITVNFIRPAQVLAIDTSSAQLKQLNDELNRIANEESGLIQQLQNLTSQEETLAGRIEILKNEKTNLQLKQRAKETAAARLTTFQKKLEALEQNNPLERIPEIRKKAQRDNLERLKEFSTLKGLFQSLKQLLFERDKMQVEVMCLEQQYRRDEESTKTLRMALKTHSEEFRKADAALTQVKLSFNQAKERAKDVFGGQPSSEEQETLVAWCDANGGLMDLPLTSLRAKLEAKQLEVEAMCVDDNAQQRYDDICRKLQEARKEIEKLQQKLSNRDAEVSRMRDQWVGPVRDMASRIDAGFSEIMNKMGYVGQVKLSEDQDVSKYELHIFVKFHEQTKLRQLVSNSQSGGEQSVSTAAFLFALQRLDNAPFRLVDEINQGMDSVNERKMWDVLLSSASSSSSSGPGFGQFFIVTPKLLSGLRFDHDTAVHVIFNGPQTPNSKTFDALVQKRLSITS
eukprot:c12118_g1_i1.p1 GENE.c12118_g1_i1~~c12118_g1_i1.p1  ORF type:complete len:1149 (+),score=333.16 c12118_g1_i1:167-3448(+)